jgi:DNA-directed RNA polymerase subunit beta'
VQPLTITADDGEVVTYALPYSAGIRVKDGDRVTKGAELTTARSLPMTCCASRGVSAAHSYLIQEVQRVYATGSRHQRYKPH